MGQLKKGKRSGGWFKEPDRHSLAAKGVKTTSQKSSMPRKQAREVVNDVKQGDIAGQWEYRGRQRDSGRYTYGYSYILKTKKNGKTYFLPLYLAKSIGGKREGQYYIIVPKWAEEELGVKTASESGFIWIKGAKNIPHAWYKFWLALKKNPNLLKERIYEIE